MDYLSTHKSGAFYEVFEPIDAKRIVDRFEFVYTPKHGNWLNMAVIELNVLQGPCRSRGIEKIEIVEHETPMTKIFDTQWNDYNVRANIEP